MLGGARTRTESYYMYVEVNARSDNDADGGL